MNFYPKNHIKRGLIIVSMKENKTKPKYCVNGGDSVVCKTFFLKHLLLHIHTPWREFTIIPACMCCAIQCETSNFQSL